MAIETVDVVIVGAGPAGLASAIVLSRQGLRVLVCDRQSLPIDKPCGEGILPPAVAHVHTLGAWQHLDPAGVYPFVGIRMHGRNGVSAASRFLGSPGLGIRRLNLSTALARAAGECRCLEIVENTAIRDLAGVGQGIEADVGGRRVRARLLIGADGLNSHVRRWAGLQGQPQRLRRLGARQHFQVPPWSDYVEVFCRPGCEAYVTPCGPETVGVAFLWDQAFYPRVPGGTALIPSLLLEFPFLEKRLRGMPTCSSAQGIGPLFRSVRGRRADGVILAGDAGGFLDACTGQGTNLALAQALALEDTVVPLFKNPSGKPTCRQLQGFSRACRRITRHYYRATGVLLWLYRHPGLFDRFLAVLNKNPVYMRDLFSGDKGLWPGWRQAIPVCHALLFPGNRHRP